LVKLNLYKHSVSSRLLHWRFSFFFSFHFPPLFPLGGISPISFLNIMAKAKTSSTTAATPSASTPSQVKDAAIPAATPTKAKAIRQPITHELYRARFVSLVQLGLQPGRHRIGMNVISQDTFPDMRFIPQMLKDFGIEEEVDSDYLLSVEINTKRQVAACWNLFCIYVRDEEVVLQVGSEYFPLEQIVDGKEVLLQINGLNGRIKSTTEKTRDEVPYTRVYASFRNSEKDLYNIPIMTSKELVDDQGQPITDVGALIMANLEVDDPTELEGFDLAEYLASPKEPPMIMGMVLEEGSTYELISISEPTAKTSGRMTWNSYIYTVKTESGPVAVYSDLDSSKFVDMMANAGQPVDPTVEDWCLEVTHVQIIEPQDGKDTQYRASAIIKRGSALTFTTGGGDDDEEE
jgi:hypothetical protein